MKERIVRITTYDTKQTYEYPAKDKSRPQLWEAEIIISCIDSYGRTNNSPSRTQRIYLERETLENAGLLPQPIVAGKEPTVPQETPEDIILRLLECVGVYPTEA